MKPIHMETVQAELEKYTESSIYIHFEAVPGGFVRNAKVYLVKAFVTGDQTYRLALKIENDGWIRAEGITDYEIDDKGRLLLAGHDSLGRLVSALQLSNMPFSG